MELRRTFAEQSMVSKRAGIVNLLLDIVTLRGRSGNQKLSSTPYTCGVGAGLIAKPYRGLLNQQNEVAHALMLQWRLKARL